VHYRNEYIIIVVLIVIVIIRMCCMPLITFLLTLLMLKKHFISALLHNEYPTVVLVPPWQSVGLTLICYLRRWHTVKPVHFAIIKFSSFE